MPTTFDTPEEGMTPGRPNPELMASPQDPGDVTTELGNVEVVKGIPIASSQMGVGDLGGIEE